MKKLSEHSSAALACVGSATAAISAGYAIGFSSPAVQDLEAERGALCLSPEQTTWFGSLLPLAAMFGSLLSGPLMDYSGRRLTVLLVISCFLVSWTIIYFSANTAMLFAGRSLSGLATGMCTAVIPIYIAEVSPASLRGKMGTLFSVLLCLGIPAAYASSVVYSWKQMAEIGCIIACLTFLVCFLLPESPYWLVREKRVAEASDSLQRLRGPKCDVSSELQDIQILQKELGEGVTIGEFTKISFLKPLVIGIFLMVFQQFSGVNAIFFYAHDIFLRANFHDENLASIIVSMVQVVVLVLATSIIDKAGRRKLLIASAFGMMLCHAILGACMYMLSASDGVIGGHEDILLTSTSLFAPKFHSNDTKNYTTHLTFNNTVNSLVKNDSNTNGIGGSLSDGATVKPNQDYVDLLKESEQKQSVIAWLSLVLVVLYVFFYALGFGPVPFIVLSEMLPQRARGAAGGIGTMSNWLCAFAITKSFRNLVEIVTTAGVFWLFSAVCMLSIIFVWRSVPETKGKTLSEIQEIFLHHNKGANLKPIVTYPERMLVRSPIKIVNQVVMGSPVLSAVRRSSSVTEQSESLMKDF